MKNTDTLHKQVHEITELNNVLKSLINDRLLCDSEVTNELFNRYTDAVQHHLTNTESGIFSQLLTNSDEQTSAIVEQFMSGSREIKRTFSRYTKKWCKNKNLLIKDHDEFLNETTRVFDLVLTRLQDETEHLYPLVQSKNNQTKQDKVA